MAQAGVTSLGESLPDCQPPWESWKWTICQARRVSTCIQPPSKHETVQTTWNCRHSQPSTETSYIPPWSISSSVRPVNNLWIISKKGHSTAMICHVTTVSTNTFGLWPSVVCTWQLAAGNFARHQLPRSPLIEEATVSAIDVASLTSLSCCQRLIKPTWSVTNMRNWIKPSSEVRKYNMYYMYNIYIYIFIYYFLIDTVGTVHDSRITLQSYYNHSWWDLSQVSPHSYAMGLAAHAKPHRLMACRPIAPHLSLWTNALPPWSMGCPMLMYRL